MISKTTPAFRERLAGLPTSAQKQAREDYRRFQQEPHHPGLHYKQFKRRGLTLHSVRVGVHYRALAYEDNNIL